MPKKITFHFDDGHMSHYETAFPLFRELGMVGCIALTADPAHGMGFEKAVEMQDAGWEIICHTVTHPRMNSAMDPAIAEREIIESKRILEGAGLHISEFVTPCSVLDRSLRKLVEANYYAAFTRYTNSLTDPIEKLVIEKPVNRYDLHRACLSGKSLDELKEYVDYVVKSDSWLVFYEHDLGKGENITSEMLRELLNYIIKKQVPVMTSENAIRSEKCTTSIIEEGWDGHECFVHTRIASDGDKNLLITSQKLNVEGCDCFDLLHTDLSTDSGRTWTGFRPDKAFDSIVKDNIRSVCCDMTPFYHKKTGKFIVTGHIAQYFSDEIFPVDVMTCRRVTPYAVFDEEKKCFQTVKSIVMPDAEKYCDCGSGCSQCLELENGDILLPISFREIEGDHKANAKAAVIRCTFDGETLTADEIGNEIEVPDEVRGIGECSVIFADGRYLLTIRGDTYGYVAVSDDGLHFGEPEKWRWDDGEIVPTYNTQSHFFTLSGIPYLVYTRKCGTNDHVFRHRAPLFAAEVDTKTLRLKQDTEFVVVPERGARLGNFGCCQINEKEARIIASEWMQPEGCEKYGSNNAVWLSEVK